MRKDAIGVYGGLSSTPNLDSFSKDSVMYNNCITPSPWTFPAHVSFLTGKYASQHGLHESFEAKGTELWHRNHDIGIETVAESLKKVGYNTIGISGNPWLYPDTIFAKGYSFFTFIGNEERVSVSDKEAVRRASKYGKSTQEIAWYLIRHVKLNDLIELYSAYHRIKTKEKQANFPNVKGGDKITRMIGNSSLEEPFFLFINFFEMHDPYTPYELNFAKKNIGNQNLGLYMADLLGLVQIPPKVMSQIRNQYFRESSYVDTFFGAIISELRKKNLYEECLIICTSDHGQALKERNYYGHSIYLYDEIVQVPLIVKYPRHKHPALDQGYQSLVYIPRLIQSVVENNYDKDPLTEPIVFSESFGIPEQSIRKVPADLRKRFDLSRKAVYKDNYKMTVNWTNMIVEELLYKGKQVSIQENKKLCDSLLNEFSAIQPSETIDNGQPVVLSPEEESEIVEKLRDLGYA